MLLDFPISLEQDETARLTLRYGENDRPEKLDNSLRVAETDESVTVVTGPLKLELSKHQFWLLNRVWLDRNSDVQFSNDERITASKGVRGIGWLLHMMLDAYEATRRISPQRRGSGTS